MWFEGGLILYDSAGAMSTAAHHKDAMASQESPSYAYIA